MRFRTAFDGRADEYSVVTALVFNQPSMTQQQFKDEVDINTIVRRFAVNGTLPQSLRVPRYGDFTGISDYREAIHLVREAEASFMSMPAELRARLDNDAGRFVEFVCDPANHEELVKYGLAQKKSVASASDSSVPPPIPAA